MLALIGWESHKQSCLGTINKLKESLAKNSDNAVMTSQIQDMLSDEEKKLVAIEEQQRCIRLEQKSRRAHKHIVVV